MSKMNKMNFSSYKHNVCITELTSQEKLSYCRLTLGKDIIFLILFSQEFPPGTYGNACRENGIRHNAIEL